jgi:PAS domain-containing protein
MRENQREQQRLQELKDFLLTRRQRLSPELMSLPVGEKRRTPGLRRTEVAQLAGISVDWYTWLEQGRPITVSSQVLESLTQALCLDNSEREYLFFLALQQPPPQRAPVNSAVSTRVQSFLDSLDTNPVYVTGERWDIVAWNEAACAVFGNFEQMSTRERNAVWHMFLAPTHRQMLMNWEENARHVLAQFRATCGRFPTDVQIKELLDDLMANSVEFRKWWSDHEVLRIPEGEKTFNHPYAGPLVFEHVTFEVYDAPELKVTVYTPVDGTETRAKLSQLIHKRSLFF